MPLKRLALCLILGWLLSIAVAKAQTPPGWFASQQGANSVYQPSHLPSGKSFVITIEPPQQSNGRPLSEWFNEHRSNDLSARGTVLRLGNAQAMANGTLTVADSYRDASGQQWIAMYSAVPLTDGSIQFCSMVSNLPASSLTGYIRTGAGILAERVRGKIGNATIASSDARSNTSSSKTNPPTPKENQESEEERMKRAIRVQQLGTGVRPDQIVAVLHEGRGVYRATGYQYEESADLLLKDGWEYSGLEVPPEDLNVQSSKQLQPKQWHRWRQQGNDYYIQDQKTGQWSKLDILRAIPLQNRINQHLLYRHATSFGGMGSYNTRNDITFRADGSFERSASVLAGSGVVQAANDFSSGASSYRDRNGCDSSAASTYSGSGSTVGTYSNSHCKPGQDANSYGTYKISGYTLELDSASGQVQRLLAFRPFADKPDIYIDGVTFYPPDNP